MKKQLLLLSVLACLISTSAFAATAKHFDQTSRYVKSMDNSNLLPTCTATQVLTYDGTSYSCTEAYVQTCPGGKILLGTDANGNSFCTDVFGSCPTGQIVTGYDSNGDIQCSGASTSTTTFPKCTKMQVLNSIDGVTFTCEDIGKRVSVPAGTLGAGCNAGNIEISTRGGNATGGNYGALGPVNVFSTECATGCQNYCAAQPKFHSGFLVGKSGGNAECICIR